MTYACLDECLIQHNWFWPFFCEELCSFNRKGFCCSWAWSCSLCEGKTSFCTGLISKKLCGLTLRLTVLHSVPYFFLLYQSPSSSLCTVFDDFSSNIDEILTINPSANVFVFVDFHVHQRDWLTCSGGTDRPSKLYLNFSISNEPTQIELVQVRIDVYLSTKISG